MNNITKILILNSILCLFFYPFTLNAIGNDIDKKKICEELRKDFTTSSLPKILGGDSTAEKELKETY